jgi:hypothetical protein
VPAQVGGQIGLGQTFDGVNDFIDVASSGWYDSNWTHRRRIIIDSSQVSGSSEFVDFPVLINSTVPDWRHTSSGGNVGKLDGTDIFFTNDEGGKYDHELEYYDPTTGHVVAWVELFSLSPNEDLTIYMYYGNAAAPDQQNEAGTWNANFAGVWHLSEEVPGTGTLDLYEDSTSNANHADDGVDATGEDGQIDGGQEFNDDYILIPDPGGSWDFVDGGLDAGTSDFTISTWFLHSSTMVERYPTIVYKGGGGSTIGYWFHYDRDDDQIQLGVADSVTVLLSRRFARRL